MQLVATDGDLMFLELRAIEIPSHLGMTQGLPPWLQE
jgi:hypothetical protein